MEFDNLLTFKTDTYLEDITHSYMILLVETNGDIKSESLNKRYK